MFIEQNIRFKSDKWELAGTLTLPKETGSYQINVLSERILWIIFQNRNTQLNVN